MRVLVLSSAFPSRTRPTYAVFVRERVRHVAQSSEVIVVAPVPWFPFNGPLRGRALADTPWVEIQDGVTVYHPRFLCVPLVSKALDGLLCAVRLLPFLARLRRRFAFDLIDAHFTYPDGLAAVIIGRVLGIPVVVTVRGTHDLYHAAFALRRPQIRYTLRAAARVITVSESLREFVAGLGVSREMIRVIPNGVDATRFAPGDRAAARARLGLSPSRTVLLSVGGLVEGKGHHLVIDLLSDLVAQHPRLLYVVVGGETPGSDYRQKLDRLVRDTGLANHVWIAGARPHEEIQIWLAAADLFCLATRSEGWCNAVMEALACGLPVVTTRVGGNAEIVREGEDGFLVPFWSRQLFGQAIVQGLAQPWNRDAISTRARASGWQHTAAQVVEEFHAVLARDPGGSTAAVSA